MTRARKLRMAALAAAVAIAVVLAGLSFASAAGLSLNGGTLSVRAAAHPCPGTASAVAVNSQGGTNYLGVVLALPPGCATKPVQLHVDRPNTTNDRDGSGTTDTAGVVSIRLNDAFSAGAANTFSATVDGWSLPVAWNTTLMPPIWCTVTNNATATCTATVTFFTGLRPGGTASASYYDVVVQTTSESWVKWEVGFNLGNTLYGGVPSRLGNADTDGYGDGDLNWGQGGDVNDISRISACSAKPVLSVVGIDSGDSGDHFYNIQNNRERRFSLVLNRTENGYFDVVPSSPSCGW